MLLRCLSVVSVCSGEGDELDFVGFREHAMSGSETMKRMRSKFPEGNLVIGCILASDAATANFNWTKVCASCARSKGIAFRSVFLNV